MKSCSFVIFSPLHEAMFKEKFYKINRKNLMRSLISFEPNLLKYWIHCSTAYGLDGPGIKSRWGEIFRTSADRP